MTSSTGDNVRRSILVEVKKMSLRKAATEYDLSYGFLQSDVVGTLMCIK